MLRAWTRRGQMEMIAELKCLARHVATLASQEGAVASEDRSATALCALLTDSDSPLSRLGYDLEADARASETRRELSAFYRIVVKNAARADALRHGNHR